MYLIMAASTSPNLVAEFWKAAFGVVIASIFAWLIGTQIAYYWDDIKRRREADLAARTEFYSVYGKFFSTWKLWDTHQSRSHIEVPEQLQWELLTQAETAEAGFESLLLKLASERHLSDQDVRLLACFRQAYQSLRERIRDNKRLEWWAMDKRQDRTGFKQYQTFKALAEYFASLLATDQTPRWFQKSSRAPDPQASIGRLLDVTSVVVNWESVAREELALDNIVNRSIWPGTNQNQL
jgi:hypothetical protein